MKERLKLFIALLVLASSNNVKEVDSQYWHIHDSRWNNSQNNDLFFGNPYTKISYPSHPTAINSDLSHSSKSIHEDVNAILEEIERRKMTHGNVFNNLFSNVALKPGTTQTNWKTSEESESTTRKSTSTSRYTTSTTKRTTTKWITRSTTPLPKYEIFHHYGNTFKDKRLLGNTYLAKNYYFEEYPPLGPGPLAKALFSSGSMWGFSRSDDYSNNNKRWDKSSDIKWRATTKAPYFENKVPGENKILPASAVIGAATAFGLESLLPLIVPAHRPLMYCGSTNIKQSPIRMDYEDVYACNKDEYKFEISSIENFRNEHDNPNLNKKLQCDLKSHEVIGNFYCRYGALYNRKAMTCFTKTIVKRSNESINILECSEGEISSHLGSFIPTTTPSDSLVTESTTQKSLSLGAQTHLFILKLMGKFDVVEMKTTTILPETYPKSEDFSWHPVPLTRPPEHTTSYAITMK